MEEYRWWVISSYTLSSHSAHQPGKNLLAGWTKERETTEFTLCSHPKKKKGSTKTANPLTLQAPRFGPSRALGRTGQPLIVEPASEDSNLLVIHFIDKTVFRVDSSGPASGEFIFQRLGFACPNERVPLDFSDKLNDSKGLFSIFFNPPGKVFEGSRIKFQALCGPRQTGFLLFGS